MRNEGLWFSYTQIVADAWPEADMEITAALGTTAMRIATIAQSATEFSLHQHENELFECQYESQPYKDGSCFTADVRDALCREFSMHAYRLDEKVPYPARLVWQDTSRPMSITRTHDPGPLIPLWKTLVQEVLLGNVETSSDVVCSGRIFLLPSGRLIYDPKVLNGYLSELPITYPRPGDLFALNHGVAVKLDLKGAFKSVPVIAEDRKYLGIIINGIKSICLSFNMVDCIVYVM